MAIDPGTLLGPYEILTLIGTGGMGEVYKARDTRLHRVVAVKVSNQQFSERFEHEARSIASLNHPRICSLYDVGPNYLVMEYIEGSTLATQIQHGPIPLKGALSIASQIADALEAAHEKHIIHRDLKPANIMIRPDGSVKVLDFGLAKRTEGPSLSAEAPTLTDVTAAGMVLGTPGYMSPEQARGLAVDKRTDIWAFGVVLYEMVTATRPFNGATTADSLAAILNHEPDLALAPERTRRLLRSCLEKDPTKRLRDIGDWERILDDAPSPVSGPATAKVPWAITSAVVLVAIILAILHFGESRTGVAETRVDITTPATADPSSFALSPDGRWVAFVAAGDGPSRLWVRSLGSTSAQPLSGTEGARSPFWSPDGRSIGFFAVQKLKRIDLSGGQLQTLADAATRDPQGAWGPQGVILFAAGQSDSFGIVAASGGQEKLVAQNVSHSGHFAPRFLPGGRKFLFATTGAERALWLGSLDGQGPKRIVEIAPGTDSAGEYLVSGWLVRVRQNNLVAQRFDAARGELSGDPVPLAESVGVDPSSMAGSFSVSPSGTIAWRTGVSRRQLIWFDRAGKELGSFGAPDDNTLFNPELSPDAKFVGITRGGLGSADVWIQDGTRASRFTFDSADDRYTIWSPDGQRVVFASNREGIFNLYQKQANAAGNEELLLRSPDNKRPNAWAPDGQFILYDNDQNNGDLMVLPLTGERKPFAFLSTPAKEHKGTFSPDGRWVAYESNATGRDEIFVRPFPGPGGQWQASVTGGISPRWRADGKELYFVGPDAKLMMTTVTAQSGTFKSETPQALFQTRIIRTVTRPQFDVARDGRFLINSELVESSIDPIHLLLHWTPPRR